jgi:hypothetical protein
MCHNNGVRKLGVRGFGLIEAIIAIAVLMTTSLGFIGMLQQLNKNVTAVEQKAEIKNTLNQINLTLVNSTACTNTFVNTTGSSQTLVSTPTAVFNSSNVGIITKGTALDVANKLSFNGIKLLGASSTPGNQNLIAEIGFRIKEKNDGTTTYRDVTRRTAISFVYDSNTKKYTCRAAEIETFNRAVQAFCTSISGTYDPSATTTSCTLPKDTALEDRVKCLEYCELNSASKTAKVTYSAQVNNKACSCMGTDPCMCLHTDTYFAFDPKRDDTCGVNRCVGTKGCVAECDDFLVPKGQTYQDSICKTTTCYGTCVDNRTCSGTENGYAAGTTYEIGCHGSRQTCQGKSCADNKYMYKFVKEETTSHANEATPVYVASKKCTYARYCYYDSKRTALDLITQVGFWDLCTVCNFDMGLCRYYDNKTKQYVNGGVTSASTGLGDMSCPSGQEYTDVSETAVKSLITSGLFCSGSGCISSCSGIGVRPIYFSW